MVDLSDLQLFVRAMASGSLSAAGRELGFSPAVASKRLTRLEESLGVRLVLRSSRRLTLTAEGAAYFARAGAILAELEEAEAEVSGDASTLRGTLSVSAPNALGRRWVAPMLAEYSARHPAVSARLSLSDRVVDLLDGNHDLAVRIGALEDSQLVSRRLARNARVVCAAPAYLEKHGRPQTPADLGRHSCLLLQQADGSTHAWRFRGEHEVITQRVVGRLATDNGELIHDWALAGLGLALKSRWDVAADLAAGRLVPLLEEWALPDADLHVIYPGRRFLPARTRQFVDTLLAGFAAAEAEVFGGTDGKPG